MVLNHFGELYHGGENAVLVMARDPTYPAAPNLETTLGGGGLRQPIDILQDQAHLIGFGRTEIFVLDLGQAQLFLVGQVFRILAPEPLAFMQRVPHPLTTLAHLGLPYFIHRLVGVLDHMKFMVLPGLSGEKLLVTAIGWSS